MNACFPTSINCFRLAPDSTIEDVAWRSSDEDRLSNREVVNRIQTTHDLFRLLTKIVDPTSQFPPRKYRSRVYKASRFFISFPSSPPSIQNSSLPLSLLTPKMNTSPISLVRILLFAIITAINRKIAEVGQMVTSRVRRIFSRTSNESS